MVEMFRPTKNSKFYKGGLAFEPFQDQYVDMIIPYHGQYDKVAALVQSIIYNTPNFFRICVVDDCSPNDIFIHAAFESLPNVKTVRNSRQLGFGASLKVGADALAEERRNPPHQSERGGFPWLVFLHSDCEIEEPNWLLYLGQTMLSLKGQGVKLISAMTDNPTVDNDILKAERMYFPRKDVILGENEYLPLYCALCHRDLFAKIGGFVKPYPYAGYEDMELAARMRKYGYRQGVCGTSWVHHDGGCTINSLKKYSEIRNSNKNIYEEDLKKLE